MEEWRDIPAYPGYMASSLGRILGKKGRVIGCFTAKYVMIGLGRNNGINRHRLIAKAFLPPAPFAGAEIDHINMDKHDDRPENLRWTDRYDNMANRNVLAHSATQIKGLSWVNPYGRSIHGRWRCTVHRHHKAHVAHFALEEKDKAIQWLTAKRIELLPNPIV